MARPVIAYDVIPLGDDGECYITPGHDVRAGWRLALWIVDALDWSIEDIVNLDGPSPVWMLVTDVTDSSGEDNLLYTRVSADNDRAEPYMAVTYGWGW